MKKILKIVLPILSAGILIPSIAIPLTSCKSTLEVKKQYFKLSPIYSGGEIDSFRLAYENNNGKEAFLLDKDNKILFLYDNQLLYTRDWFNKNSNLLYIENNLGYFNGFYWIENGVTKTFDFNV